MIDDREAAKAARRAAACFEACAGLPTEQLERVAAMPLVLRPAALAEAARRRAMRHGAVCEIEP